MIAIIIINFIFFYFASIYNKRVLKINFTIFFIFTSIILRLIIKNEQLPDYDSYYSVIGTIEPEFSFKILLSEPYYFQLVNLFNLTLTAEKSINLFYYFNFIITLSFFTWLIFKKEITPWKKVLLFSLYYHVFTFILLRNTIAYILIAYLFYHLGFNKITKKAFLSFFSHMTSLPALLSSLFKNKHGDLRLVIIMIIFVTVFSQLVNLELFNLYQKFSTYQDSQEYGISTFHKLYFFAFLLINIYLFIYKRNMVFNYTYFPIFVTYLILQNTNAVMGYRFSIYLILYLLFYKNQDSQRNYKGYKSNIFAFSFIIIILINLKSIFP